MVKCTLKLRCDGVERSVQLDDSKGGKGKKEVVSSLDDLVKYLGKHYEIDHFRLTYLDEDDHAVRVTNNKALRDAAADAPRDMLHLKVTSYASAYHSPRYNAESWVDYLSYPGPAPDKGPGKPKVVDAAKLSSRFAVHNVTCYRCAMSPIRGKISVYKLDDDCCVCQKCVSFFEDDAWKARPFPWSKAVPKAPLSSDDSAQRDDVRHLQKIMTELGYMKLEHTDEYEGSFQTHTENAVKAFRLEYEVLGGDLSVYNKKTELMLAQVLRK